MNSVTAILPILVSPSLSLAAAPGTILNRLVYKPSG